VKDPPIRPPRPTATGNRGVQEIDVCVLYLAQHRFNFLRRSMSERQPALPTAAAQAAAARGAVECVLAALLKHHRAL